MKQGNSESDQTPNFVCFRKVVYVQGQPPNFVCFRKRFVFLRGKNRIFDQKFGFSIKELGFTIKKIRFEGKKSDFREKNSGFRFPHNVS